MPGQKTATTRSLTRVQPATRKHSPGTNPVLRLHPGAIVRSALSRRQYRVGAMLGFGGFGAVYEITQITGGKSLDCKCVLKVTVELGAWHREAYFGELLRETPGVVQVFESFAWIPPGPDPTPLYCLVSELLEGGDLVNYLQKNTQPWAEAKARREIIRLLGSLQFLHAAGLVHRDITPRNVFVTSDLELKLGDFGIAVQQLGKQKAKADVFAPWFAPTAIRQGKAGAWLPADDVYHLGKIFALLLHGGEKTKLTPNHVKSMPCSSWAKSIIQRCIGVRRKRFANAAEMLAAMRKPVPNAEKTAAVRSLEGKRVVFTGKMTMLRKNAAKLLEKQAGGILQKQVGPTTDIVVIGEQSPHWKAESKGQKLLDLDREKERGHAIAVITERRFKSLLENHRKS